MPDIANPPAPPRAPAGEPPVIHARGSMADRVRCFDWASTPLGSIASWSSTLASYVDLILSSPQPAVLMWGDDLTLFYNDGVIPTLGDRHPTALGRSYRAVFADAWPLVGPDIESCFLHGNTPVLWVSKEIVERHAGRLHLRSSQQPGSRGTVFTIFLPYEAVLRGRIDP